MLKLFVQRDLKFVLPKIKVSVNVSEVFVCTLYLVSVKS